MTMFRRRTIAITGASAAAVVALAGCTPPGGGGSDVAVSFTEIDAPVTPEQVAELGDVTLDVWADQGEQNLMDAFIPAFEERYPNVTVNVQFKSYSDLTATVLNAMNSDDAPDVTQGNQGWSTDGALVGAGLLRPLDDVAEAYGYADAVGEIGAQLRWGDGGEVFGEGSFYGVSPDNQMVGLYANTSILADLGLEVPTTLEEFEQALRTVDDAGQIGLQLGNADRAGAMQALSLIQGARTPAAETRDWVMGADGASFDTEANVEAIETFAGWVDEGFVVAGYDGTTPDDAAAAFANGQGAFFIGGSWFASTISDGSAFTYSAGFGDSRASNGSFGLPWHVGARTDAELAALAFVGMIVDEETSSMLVDANRVPIWPVEAADASGSIFPQLVSASQEQLESEGALFWYDWATDTMFDTFTIALQEVLAGRASATDMVNRVQEDWTAFRG